MNILFIICCLFPVINAITYSLQDLRRIFREQSCLKGTLQTFILPKYDEKFETILKLTETKDREKSVLSKLAELAQYHQIDYYFKLEKEEGPPHQRLFTVSLILGKETYTGQGKRHKFAKENAATIALENTEYELPKMKEKNEHDIEQLTPTVLLNNVGAKLGIEITYYLIDKDKEEILHSNIVLTEKNKDYMKKLNSSIYKTKNLKVKKDIETTKGPFRIKLKMGENIFYATSHSIQSGRHEVATIALEFLAKNKDKIDIACLKEGFEEQCKSNKNQLKSPISKVYEEASKRKLGVEFEVIEESGPAHKRKFVTECKVGDTSTKGSGSSKKESKRNAAIGMLEKIMELGPVSPEREIENLVKTKSRKKQKNKMVKTKMDEINIVLDKVQKSVLGFAQNIFGSKDEEITDKDNFHGSHTDKKDDTEGRYNLPKSGRSAKEEILEIGKILNLKLTFADYAENEKFGSILSLYTDPQYTCFGEDKTEFDARDVAAKNALDLLTKMGIYDLFLDYSDTSLERETKEEIKIILDQKSSEYKNEEL